MWLLLRNCTMLRRYLSTEMTSCDAGHIYMDGMTSGNNMRALMFQLMYNNTIVCVFG